MSTWHFTLKKLPVQYENNQSQTDRLPLTGCIGGLRSPIYIGRQLLSLNHYLVGTHVLLDMRQTLRTWLHVRGNTPHNPAVVHQRGYHSNKKTRSPSCGYSDGKVTASIEYRSNDVTKNFFFAFQRFGYHVLWSMMKNIHSPNLVGIGSWGARDMAAWIPN